MDLFYLYKFFLPLRSLCFKQEPKTIVEIQFFFLTAALAASPRNLIFLLLSPVKIPLTRIGYLKSNNLSLTSAAELRAKVNLSGLLKTRVLIFQTFYFFFTFLYSLFRTLCSLSSLNRTLAVGSSIFNS